MFMQSVSQSVSHSVIQSVSQSVSHRVQHILQMCTRVIFVKNVLACTLTGSHIIDSQWQLVTLAASGGFLHLVAGLLHGDLHHLLLTIFQV
jgi:hypothetical protein